MQQVPEGGQFTVIAEPREKGLILAEQSLIARAYKSGFGSWWRKRQGRGPYDTANKAAAVRA